MFTLLVQVEAILNSRPLVPLSNDPNDFEALTPGHFLVGCPLTAYPEPSLKALPWNKLSRWQRVEQIKQHFWRRTVEYLANLGGQNYFCNLRRSKHAVLQIYYILNNEKNFFMKKI